jgi:hypothetical protein
MFGILRIGFEVMAAKIDEAAWIYIPYSSPHRANPYQVEIIAHQLNLQGHTDCKIRIVGKAKVLV